MEEIKKQPVYYDLNDDVNKYPDAWLYIVMSKRGPGKTYSTLRKMVEDDARFAFLKRTKEDVKLLVEGRQTSKELDTSPFVPLNRDFGWDIRPMKAFNGLAGFYEFNEFDGEEVPGKFRGYCVAANMATKVKGMDMSIIDWFIWDEFIENPWDVVPKKLGDAVLSLYETMKRDRKKRGRPEIKMVLLANAVKVDCVMLRTLNLVDIVAEMDITGQEYYYDEYKRIMIHIIDSDFDLNGDEEKDGIEKTMEGTAWAASSYGAHFAYNDFTAIGKQKLKGHRCILHLKHLQKDYYVYKKGSTYFFTTIKGQCDKTYNLDRENQQKLFWMDYGIDLRQAAIEDRVIFSSYSGYDLIVNYRKNFNL